MLMSSTTHGARHGEAGAIRILLTDAGVPNPITGEPLSEALCFGIAGGIGAGYSFCPSVPKYGCASGVSIVGRHKAYATDAAWYQGCFDRLGIKTRITETSAAGKALANLQAEIAAGRPTVVWCSRSALPFTHDLMTSCGLWMHSFVVTEIDENEQVARGYDRPPVQVSISLKDLAEARGGICSHKNRTLTVDAPKKLSAATLKGAVLGGIRACVDELYLKPRMKTFSLAGLETLAKVIDNDKAKDGWLKVFTPGLLYHALRDAFDSIETSGTGGGLYRSLYAEFLQEAAVITGRRSLAELAERYSNLATQWTETGEFLLPGNVKPLAETRKLLVKQRTLYETKGPKADKQLAEITASLRKLATSMQTEFPLDGKEQRELLHGVRLRIESLHAAEKALANDLAAAAA